MSDELTINENKSEILQEYSKIIVKIINDATFVFLRFSDKIKFIVLCFEMSSFAAEFVFGIIINIEKQHYGYAICCLGVNTTHKGPHNE
uniref:CSON001745 protein n=1 Tax=Culicoides sonorensis TaxID=179676 RepID=A0A336MIR7_CULSO